jgi:hypothetical protein
MLIETLIVCFLIILVGLLLIFTYIKKKRIAKAATIVRNASETIVNSAMLEVAKQLKMDGLEFDGAKGKSVADVWGQSVVGFNYHADLKKDTDIKAIETKVNDILFEYCKKHQLEDEDGPLLQVSDIWINQNHLELDVVYLINQQTKNYLNDLSKL